MLPAEIIPRHEDGLHGYVVLEALAVAIGQASEPAQAHANGQIEPLDMAGAYPVFVAHRRSAAFQCLLSWPASSAWFLGCWRSSLSVGRSQLAFRRQTARCSIGPQAIGRQLETAIADGVLQLQQERPARIAVALADLVGQNQFGFAFNADERPAIAEFNWRLAAGDAGAFPSCRRTTRFRQAEHL